MTRATSLAPLDTRGVQRMPDAATGDAAVGALIRAEFDPLRDEGVGDALRLLQAGAPVELHQWASTFHGSQAILPQPSR